MKVNDSQLQEIELTIDQAQKSIDEMAGLDRLRDNKDWVELIEKGYLESEAARLVAAKADPQLQDELNQRSLDKMIDAVGYFRQYLNKIYQFGHTAERTIESHRDTRTQIQDEVMLNG